MRAGFRAPRTLVTVATLISCLLPWPSLASGPSVSTPTYGVQLESPGSCAAGAACTATLNVATKGGATLDPNQPLTFELKPPSSHGLTFPKPKLKREDGRFDDKKGALPIPFTAEKAGKALIGGVLSMGVCSEGICVMQKVELEVQVDVK